MYKTLDLKFRGLDDSIAAFLIESTDGPILIECGPYSTFASLEKGLKQHGYALAEVKHVFLSHIHFDHAGAAWAFAENGANIYLHPYGAAHMHDPSKLMASATMIYGDMMDELWGRMKGIPEEQLKTIQHLDEVTIGEHTFTALHTPGHARHHIAWEVGDMIFTGDVAGCKIGKGPVVPPCPPPDINVEDWLASIDLILDRNPNRLVLTHFDEFAAPNEHMENLKFILQDWSEWIKPRWEKGATAEELTPQFVEYTNNQLRTAGASEEIVKKYEAANPSWMSVAGLIRYWKKKRESKIS